MTDTITNLRDLLSCASPGPWCNCHGHMECRSIADLGVREIHAPDSPFVRADPEDDAALIVALRNHAEALLEVVEAAKEYLSVSAQYGMQGAIQKDRLLDALAKLGEVKP